MGNLSLFQRIFLTQKLNWSHLHFRQILYQLSYQRNPNAGYLGSIPKVNPGYLSWACPGPICAAPWAMGSQMGPTSDAWGQLLCRVVPVPHLTSKDSLAW